MRARRRALGYLPFAPALFAAAEVVRPTTLPSDYAAVIAVPAALLCLTVALFGRRSGSAPRAARYALIGIGLLAAYLGLSRYWLYRDNNHYEWWQRSVVGLWMSEKGEMRLRADFSNSLRQLHASLDPEAWYEVYDVRSQLGVVAALALLYVGSFASLTHASRLLPGRVPEAAGAPDEPDEPDEGDEPDEPATPAAAPRAATPAAGRSDFTVFISYAHRDNEHADPSRRWLNRLLEHIQPLVLQGQVSTWADTELEAGDQWHETIQTQLQSAKVAVLLVSPAFLASKYIRDSELPALLLKAKQKGLTVLPIIVRPSLYSETRFKYTDPARGPEEVSLDTFQSANPPERPLNMMEEHEQDALLVSVAQRILRIADSNS